MGLRFLQKINFFKRIIYYGANPRSKEMVERIEPFLSKSDRMIDIGSGTCHTCEVLLGKGYNVIPLDVENLSCVDNILPIIYDGQKIPFDNDEFDKSLILTVLHHTKEPTKILQEAIRVSKRIILIEDIYSNRFQKYTTYFFDSLLNFQFIGHPHTNKSDQEWKETFKELQLKLIDARYKYSFLFFRHATYYLQK